jgi:flagellar protein FlaF
MSKHLPHNPYGKVAKSYAAQESKQEDARATEAKALLKAAKQLMDLQKTWDTRTPQKIEDVLKYNRQLWVLFYENAVSNVDDTRPAQLATNVINLANFVFKRSTEILAAPESDKLNILININREVANGLMSRSSK